MKKHSVNDLNKEYMKSTLDLVFMLKRIADLKKELEEAQKTLGNDSCTSEMEENGD